MLDTILAHAREHLERCAENGPLERALVGFYTDFCAEAWERQTSVPLRDEIWYELPAEERHNVRIALTHHREGGDAAGLARLCSTNWFVWFFLRDTREAWNGFAPPSTWALRMSCAGRSRTLLPHST